jgi:hypothetical protein
VLAKCTLFSCFLQVRIRKGLQIAALQALYQALIVATASTPTGATVASPASRVITAIMITAIVTAIASTIVVAGIAAIICARPIGIAGYEKGLLARAEGLSSSKIY